MYSASEVQFNEEQSKWLKQQVAAAPLDFLQDPMFFLLHGRRMDSS